MAIDTTGDNGGNNAPIGTEFAGGSTPPSTEPASIELKDDSLIRVPGIDKPVKYGEHVKGFQSQFTKASQRAAALERELTTEREARARYEQEKQRNQAGANQAQPDVFGALRELPYLSGEQAVEVVQGITAEIRKRDQVLVAALTRMQQMEQRLGGLYDSHTNSSFDSKISKWVTDLGYGPEAIEVAKEIYLAYEGNDLDQEFPRIFGDRMKQLESLFEARKRSALERGRRTPFVPGKGGQTGPSNPLQLKGNESSKAIADLLWDGMGNSAGT